MGRLGTLAKSFKATFKRGKRHNTDDDEKPVIPNHPYGARGRIPIFDNSDPIDDDLPRSRPSGRNSNTHSGSTTLASAQAGGSQAGGMDYGRDGAGDSYDAMISQSRRANGLSVPSRDPPPSRASTGDISYDSRPLLDRFDSDDYAYRRRLNSAPGQIPGADNPGTSQSMSTTNVGEQRDNGGNGDAVTAMSQNESKDQLQHEATYQSQAFYDQYDELHEIERTQRARGLNPTASVFQPESSNPSVLSPDATSDHEREDENRSLTNQQSTSRDGGDQWDRRRSAASLVFNEGLEPVNHDSQAVSPMPTLLAGRILAESDGMRNSEAPWDGTLEESDLVPSRARRAGPGSIHADFLNARRSSADNPTTQGEGSESKEKYERKGKGVAGGCRPPNENCDGSDSDHSDDEESRTFKPVDGFTGPSNSSKVAAKKNPVSLASKASKTSSSASEAEYENIIITEGIDPYPTYSVEEGFETYLQQPASRPSGLETLIRSYGSDFAGYIARHLIDLPDTLDSASLHSLGKYEPFEFVGLLKREIPTWLRAKSLLLENASQNFSSGEGSWITRLRSMPL